MSIILGTISIVLLLICLVVLKKHKNAKKSSLLVICFLTLIIIFSLVWLSWQICPALGVNYFLQSCSSNNKELNNCFEPLRVAHAGGEINGKIYTNSIEALNLNYDRGFRYFELDFSCTKDGKLVCIHDWQSINKMLIGENSAKRLSFKQLKKLAEEKLPYHILYLRNLKEWMIQHPSTIIITDVKDVNNFIALKIIMGNLPDANQRVIPQIYSPENFFIVRKLGYKGIIWTLYRYRGSNKDVLKWVKVFSGSFAVTMPLSRVKSGLAGMLYGRDIPVYVHTINSFSAYKLLKQKFGVSEIYTDILAPKE